MRFRIKLKIIKKRTRPISGGPLTNIALGYSSLKNSKVGEGVGGLGGEETKDGMSDPPLRHLITTAILSCGGGQQFR